MLYNKIKEKTIHDKTRQYTIRKGYKIQFKTIQEKKRHEKKRNETKRNEKKPEHTKRNCKTRKSNEHKGTETNIKKRTDTKTREHNIT